MNRQRPNPIFDEDTAVGEMALQVRTLAAELYHRAWWLVWVAAGGLGASFGIMFYLWRDWKLGYGVHPAAWEAPLAALVGVLVGAGSSLPFAMWLRLQAKLVVVQLKMEENTRKAHESSERTAKRIDDLAAMTGEYSAFAESGDRIPTLRNKE